MDLATSSSRALLLSAIAALAVSGCKGPEDTGPATTSDTGGFEGFGNLTVEPCQFDCGQVAAHSTNTSTFSVSNTGSGDLTVLGVTVTAPFSANTVTPVTVAPGSRYQFTMIFAPSTFGDFSTELIVQSDDPDLPDIRCPIGGEVVTDGDGDGYDSAEAGGTDCDDANPDINPGADELWYDGVDYDCDGANDYDQDGDGFISSAYNEDPATGGGDCQDVDASISPAATDEWYDGVDSDCDGANDYDRDGDGFTAAGYGGTDCNDDEPLANPTGTEAWNGIDDDCNGLVDDEIDELGAEIGISAVGGGEATGQALAGGDFDGNGVADLVIGSPFFTPSGAHGTGRVSIFMNDSAADGDTVTDSDYLFTGPSSTADLGYSLVNLGDFDGDGVDDLAMGGHGANGDAGRIYIFSGPDLATEDLGAAAVTLSGWEDMHLGRGLSTTDLDGDGLGDMVAYGIDVDMPYNYLAVQYGDEFAAGAVDFGDADATWMVLCGPNPVSASAKGCGVGTNPAKGGNAHWPRSRHAPVDLDGDGYQDLVLADGYADPVTRDEGAVYVLWGRSVRFSGHLASIHATGTMAIAGTVQDGLLGRAVGVAPDVDGDGDAELWVTDDERGDVHFVLGDPDLRYGTLTLPTDANATLDTGSDTDAIGGIHNVGDWTGDGVGDVAFSYFLETDKDNGLLFIMESQLWSGTYDFDDEASLLLIGGDEGEVFSTGMPVVPTDLDGDGRMDLMVGDPVGGASEDGRAHIYYNHHGL